jgi:hypothetical protein
MTVEQKVTRMLHEAHLRYQRQQLALRRNDTTLPLSADAEGGNVLEVAELRGLHVALRQCLRKWRSVHYYKLFCDHDIPRWQVCKSTLCRRTQSDADRFLAKLVTGGVL